MVAQCTVTAISPSSLSAGNGSGQVAPTVSVTSQNNCTTYTISNSYAWISYSKNGLSVAISVQANTGSARTGYVYIGGLTLTVNQACGNVPAAAGSITGTPSVCSGQTGVAYSVGTISGATGYSWSLPPRVIIASGSNTNSITVNYTALARSGDITVTGTNSCASGSPSPDYSVTVNLISQPGPITGTTSVCAGSTYTYSVSQVSGASSYTWTIPSGATGTSTTNSINVTFGSNSGTISVVANSSAGCSSTPSSLAVSISTLTQYAVTGGGTICPGGSEPIGLLGSTSGIQYKCYLNGSFLAPPITGTGNAISFGNQSAGGTYTATGVTSAGCEVPMSGSQTITVLTNSSAPTGITATPATLCPNSSSTLTVNGGSLGSGANWVWYTGGCGTTSAGTGNSISVTPNATTTYYVRAEGTCGLPTSCATTTVTVTTPPTITVQPSNVTICAGAATSFSVTATGATSYQWQNLIGSTWTNISGATSSTYSIASTTGMGGMSFQCLVTGSCSLVTPSTTASITFSTLTPYNVTGGGTICPGGSAPIGLDGSTSGIQYKCYLNGSFLAPPQNGGGSTISFGNQGAGGTYTVTGVTSIGCEVPMNGSQTITVLTNSTAPTGINATQTTLCPGSGSTLTVSGGSLGTGASWKWYTGGCGTTSAGTGNSISVTPGATTTYYVRAEGTCGQTTCASITITVTTPPTITVQPSSVTICAGAATSFSVTATGATSYQWQNLIGSTWTNISGATSSTYSIASTTGMGGMSFQCLVTGTCSLTTPSTTASITFSTLTPYNVTGGGMICPGGSTPIGLDGSTSGIQYKCYLNGSFLAPPQNGTGGTISWNQGAGGTYTITGTTSIGCVVPMNGSQTITVLTNSTAPTGITANPATLCPNSSSTLTVSGGSLGTGAAWVWYTGGCGTTQIGTGNSISVTPNATTTYYIRAEGTCGLPTSCASVTVVVKALPSITLQPSNSTIILNQDASFSVTATGPNLQYQWQSSPSGVDSWTNLTGLPAIGFQTSNLTIQGSSTFVPGFYRCQITSDCSTIYSNNVQIILSFPASGYLMGTDIPDPETRTLDTTLLVGATNGSFNINPMGGASYTIPLQVPPGVNGLAPNLSMAYSSNNGSGIPGFGWQIGGISTISLGARTAYNDAYQYPNSDMFDRFYLDGQRLQPNSSSSPYGDSNTRYQTENDIFTRVTPQATDSYGPTWFKAETKSGYIFEYGNTPDSRQRISENSRVLNWYVSKISDLFGNQMNFTYIQDHYSVYPSQITYGPNIITFYYKQRNDKNFYLLNGIRIEQWLLLNKIVVKYNSTVIKTYVFNQSYQGSNYNSNSILNEVIEYGLGSSRLNSTVFSYQIPDNVSFSQTAYNTTHAYLTYQSKLITGDFNGDGKADFLCIPDPLKGGYMDWAESLFR